MRHTRRLNRMMSAANWSKGKGPVARLCVALYVKHQWPELLREVRLDTYEKLAGVDGPLRP